MMQKVGLRQVQQIIDNYLQNGKPIVPTRSPGVDRRSDTAKWTEAYNLITGSNISERDAPRDLWKPTNVAYQKG